MPEYREDWVIRKGVPVAEHKVDRGRLLFTSKKEMRSRLARFILILILPIWALSWIIVFIIETLSSSSQPLVEDPVIGAVCVIGILGITYFGFFAVILAIMTIARSIPGIYENGIEPIYPMFFLPYEEIDGTSYRDRWLGRMQIIHTNWYGF